MGITETYVSGGSQRFAACQPNRALCDRHHMQQRKTRCSRPKALKAASISALVLASSVWMCSPMARAAVSTSLSLWADYLHEQQAEAAP
jgi:hypothetical protein